MSKYKAWEETYGVDVEKEDILYCYKLPTMQRFISKSKKDEHCPYIKFQRYLNKQLKRKAGIDPQTEIKSISQVVLHKKDAEELNKAVLKWIPIWKGYIKGNTAQIESAFSWLHLDIGPSVSTSEAIQPGYVYVRKFP